MSPPRSHRLALTLALALATMLAIASASAQPNPPPVEPPTDAPGPPPPDAPTAADKAIAAEKYQKGADLAKQGHWKEAYPLFLEAWQHLQHWQIALSLGRVEIEIDRFHAAEEHLSFALESTDLPSTDRPEVTRLIALAREKQGALRVLATAQGQAHVMLDERRIGVTPFSGTISADPGDHRLELRLGNARQARLVHIESGQTAGIDIDLRLPKIAPMAPPPAPQTVAAVEPGPAAPAAPLRLAIIGTGASLTVTALAIGAGLAVVSADRAAELDEKGFTAATRALADERLAFWNGAVWSFFAAGMLAVGTGAAVLLWPSPPGSNTATLQLRWTGLGAQAAIHW